MQLVSGPVVQHQLEQTFAGHDHLNEGTSHADEKHMLSGNSQEKYDKIPTSRKIKLKNGILMILI